MTAANTPQWSAETTLGHLLHSLSNEEHTKAMNIISLDGNNKRNETFATSAEFGWLGMFLGMAVCIRRFGVECAQAAPEVLNRPIGCILDI